MVHQNMTVSNRIAATIFGLLALGTAVAFPATAVADDPPPDPMSVPGDPPPPSAPLIPFIGAPTGPGGLNVLAQTGADPVPGALGAPPVIGLDRETLLGQNASPSAPSADPGTPPNLNVFNNAYGIQENDVPAAPGQGQQFDVAPGDENSDVSRREWFGRWIDLQRAGRTYGGLGQAPPPPPTPAG